MPKKRAPSFEFGKRLLAARKQQGLTQIALAKAANTTQRVISGYETNIEWPTVPQLLSLCKVLECSSDELLGIRVSKSASVVKVPPEEASLLKRLRALQALPEKDRRAVVRLIDSVGIAKEARKTA